MMLSTPTVPARYSPSVLPLHRYVRRVGVDYLSGGSSTGIVIFLLSPRRLPAGRVRNVILHNAGSGTFSLVLVRPGGGGTLSVVQTASITTGSSGTITLVAGVDFPAWQLDGSLQIGIQCGTSGAPGLRFNSSSGEGYQFVTSTVSGTFTPSMTTAGELYYTVTVDVEEPRAGGATLERTDFSCLPHGYVNGSTPFTFSSLTRAATSGATGLANQLRSGNPIALANRTLRWRFSLSASTAIGAFLTNPIEGGIAAGSLVRVNANSQILEIMGAYSGANDPAQITPEPCAISANTQYWFEWTKEWKGFTISLKTLAGVTLASLTREGTPDGYSIHPSYGYDQGMMHGAPGFAAIAGAMTVYEFQHIAACVPNVWLQCFSDSTGEPFGVKAWQGWFYKIQARLGRAQVAASSIGGAVTTGTLTRMAAELPSLRPRNVLIFLGTNSDASFATNIYAIAYAAQQIGANVYIANVPTSSSYSTTIAGMPAWVRKLDIASVLATGGTPGAGVVAAKYTNTDAAGNNYNDGIHMNAIGYDDMFGVVQSSAPELLVIQ